MSVAIRLPAGATGEPYAAMHRLIVLNDAPAAKGGATTLAIEAATGAARAGVPVTYVTAEGPQDPRLHDAGVEVLAIRGRRLSPGERLSGAVGGLWRRTVYERVGRLILDRDTSGTVYHLHNWGHFLSPAVFAALKPVRHRLVLTAHDFLLVCPTVSQYDFRAERPCALRGNGLKCLTTACDRRGPADKLWRNVRQAVRQRVFDPATAATQIAVIHSGQIPALLRGGVPRERIVEIRNPIRPFANRRIRAESNREVAFIGRLSYEKGPDLAAEAARRAGLPIRFFGDGPMRAELQRTFPGAVFEGQCDRQRIAEALTRARIAVMSSRVCEPFGLAAGEALWSGVPVVTGRHAFLGPEIAALGAGRAVDIRDPAALAGALGEIAADDTLARRLSEAAFSATRALGLTPEDWLARYAALYGRVLREAAT